MTRRKRDDTSAAADAIWQQRYEAAHRELDSPAAIGDLLDLVARADPRLSPLAVPVAGAERLRAARRVGLFPGSFNPLTLAHLALADSARTVARLDLVVWAMASVTIDKERVERASLPDRLAQLAPHVRSQPGYALALLNHGLYVDEARATRELLAPDVELFILTGYDKIVQIFDPRYYDDRTAALDELFSLASVLVAPRAGAGEDALRELLAAPENRSYARHVRFISVPERYTGDSSTEARELAAAGHTSDADLRGLVPPEGAALIRETGAYTPLQPRRPDAYALRIAWEHEIWQDVPPAKRAALPPLSTLVDISRKQSERGRLARRWLRGETWPERPRTILDLQTRLGVGDV